MDIEGFDYEPTRILVRIGNDIGPCDMIHTEDGRCFLVLDWIRTHDGDIPKETIQIDPARLSPIPETNSSVCKFVLNGQLDQKSAKPWI